MNFLDSLIRLLEGNEPPDNRWANAPEDIRKLKDTKQAELGRYNSGVLTKTTPPNYDTGLGAFIPQEELPYQSVPLPVGTPMNNGTPEDFDPTNPDSFYKMAQPAFQEYQFPESVGMGMYAAEGRGKGMGAERQNWYNIGAVDEDPEAATSYKTPQEGLIAFLKMVTGNAEDSFYGNGPAGKKAFADAFKRFQETGNEDELLLAIQNAGYAGDPATYAQRSNSGYDSYSGFVSDTPEYKKFRKTK